MPLVLDPQMAAKQKEIQRYLEGPGEIVFEINTAVNNEYELKPNIDYEYNEMNDEQKEVYKAMIDDGEGYEELDDNFVLIANDGQVPMVKIEENGKDLKD